MSVDGAGVRRAAVLGTVTGARTFLAPAALALRGRSGRAAKFAVPALAAAEIVGDKLPMAPPRVEGPGLVGRVVSAAISGRVSGGAAGARVGAAFALAATYPSQALRARIVRRTPLPDIACAVPEDLIGMALVAGASSEPRPDPADRPAAGPGFVRAAGIGAAAGLVGAAAMTSAQVWLYGLAGGDKKQRPAPNTATQVLCGAGWGKAFGLVWGRGERPPGPARGLVFGMSVWATSLAMLPTLGLADAPWRRPLPGLAQDLGLHLVYGFATTAAYEAFTA